MLPLNQSARQRQEGDTNIIYKSMVSALSWHSMGFFAVVLVFANNILQERIVGPIDGYTQNMNGTIVSPSTGSSDNMVNVTTYLKTEEEPQESHNKKGVYCQWAPGNNTDCMAELIPSMCDTTMNSSKSRIGARILLFGDSTMFPVHHFLWPRLKMLDSQATCQFHCDRKDASRCKDGPLYGFDNNMSGYKWIRKPQKGREGPTDYGLKHHGCSDCVSAPESLCLYEKWICVQ
jgi:hypothetical protein